MNTRVNRNGNHAGTSANPRGANLVKTRKPKRRGVPEPERRAVAAEIRALLQAEDETGRRLWTQTSLGERCGGVSQQMIYLAQEPDGVGPSVRDGLLDFTGMTMHQLLEKHGQLGRGGGGRS
ncbi:MAG TPA: hypothetical protein VFQ61_11150 [Polyangiaceae bacterium]|nr:hypothetical protein [Polyangiaceae bacterium]